MTTGTSEQVRSSWAHTRPSLLVALLAAAQFMLIVDVTVVQVSLPTIASDLGLGRDAMTWVVTGYTVAFGGLMVLGGRFADALGARRVFLTGLGGFVLASLVSGTAGDGALLLTGRFGQGVCAALMSPAALAIITTALTGRARDRALGIWAAIGGAGAAAGVLLGGALTAGPGWRWVFFVNVPVGLAALVAVTRQVPPDRRPPSWRGIDLAGGALVTGSTALLIHGFVHAGDHGWASTGTLTSLAGAVAGYVVLLVVESRVSMPLIRAATVGRRPVLAAIVLMLVGTSAMLGMFFLSSLYLQNVLGYGPMRTGLVFLPVAVAITAGAHLGGQLLAHLGGRVVAVSGLTMTAVGSGLLTQVSADGNLATVLLPGFIVGAFGIGSLFVTAFSAMMAKVEPEEAGVAAGVINTFHELGGAVGVAVVSTVAGSSIVTTGGASVSGFADGYLTCAIAAGVAALVSLVLVPGGRTPGGTGGGHGHGGHGGGHGHG
jgi:EmrB/QacA subfamily drug resistance transporter